MRSLIVVAFVMGACGGDDHPGGDIDPAQYAILLANARCQFYARCGVWSDAATCEMFIYSKSIPDPGLPAAIAAGVTKFDAAQAQACLDSVTATPCDETAKGARVVPPACLAAVTGLGAMGATCAQNTECASNACNVPSCTMACCTGTCVAARAPAQAGESCVGRECADGLACTPDTEVCVARVGAGGPCVITDECNYGLGCDATTMTCAVLPLNDQPCPDNTCAELGARCLGGTCTHVGTTGEPCTGLPDCAGGYTCDVTTTHACQPLPALGQPCTFECSGGAWCDMDQPMGSRTCIAPKPNGGTCTTSPFACQSLYCDTTAGVCADAPVCI
jgi:hypothetical protein